LFPFCRMHVDAIGNRFSVHWRGCIDYERDTGRQKRFARGEESRK
jgi:hypothetical protein